MRGSWTVVVGLCLACGSESEADPPTPGASGGAGSGGVVNGGGSGGGDAAGTAGSSAGTSGGGSGGSAGGGEFDASCRERTSNHVAGSQIGLRNLVTAEGDQDFQSFYDLATGEDCEFRPDADGVTRCMPLASDEDTDNLYYLDTGCTDLIEYKGICAKDLIAVRVTPDACDERVRLFPYGDPLPDSVVYSHNAQGACVEYGTLNHLYRRGPELNPADYPEVTTAEWAGLGRIATFGFEAEGGFHAAQGYRDTQLGEACVFRSMRDGKDHCTPNELGYYEFSDAECNGVMTVPSNSCASAPTPRYAGALSADECMPGTYFFAAGGEFTGPFYDRWSCQPAAEPVGQQAFTMTEVPDGDFMAVEISVNQDDPGRLKPVYRTSADGGCWFQGWWDDELQTRCQFEMGNDDYLYCLPSAATGGSQLLEAFSEATCTVPAPYLRVPSCSASEVPAFVTETVQPTCAGDRRAVRQVLDAGTPGSALPALWTDSSGTCEPMGVVAEDLYFALGEHVDYAMFVTGELSE